MPSPWCDIKVGARLRAAREKQGLSQRQLAEQSGCATAAHISRIEAGIRVPSLHVIFCLASALGEDADWLRWGRAAKVWVVGPVGGVLYGPFHSKQEADAYAPKVGLKAGQGLRRPSDTRELRRPK